MTGPGLEGVHCTNQDTMTGPKGGRITAIERGSYCSGGLIEITACL